MSVKLAGVDFDVAYGSQGTTGSPVRFTVSPNQTPAADTPSTTDAGDSVSVSSAASTLVVPTASTGAPLLSSLASWQAQFNQDQDADSVSAVFGRYKQLSTIQPMLSKDSQSMVANLVTQAELDFRQSGNTTQRDAALSRITTLARQLAALEGTGWKMDRQTKSYNELLSLQNTVRADVNQQKAALDAVNQRTS